MRLNIDILMIILLAVLLISFAGVVVFGEIWRVNLSTEGARPPIDISHAQIAFTASCVGIAAGATMLYIMEKRFGPQKNGKEATSESVLR